MSVGPVGSVGRNPNNYKGGLKVGFGIKRAMPNAQCPIPYSQSPINKSLQRGRLYLSSLTQK